MLQGITTAFILSLALFPGNLWLARVGFNGKASQCLVLGLAFGLSQFIWLFLAVPGLMMMFKHLSFIYGPMHWFAAFVLLYMAVKFFRSKPAETLADTRELPSSSVLFRNTFSRSLAMPMRLPAAVVVLMATGTFVGHPAAWSTVPGVLLGALIGVVWWWGKLTLLAVFFAKRIPEKVTLKSINKSRPFCGLLFVCLALLALFWGFCK